MHTFACSIFIWIVLAHPILGRNNQESNPIIISPRPGQALQGVVEISGSSDMVGFLSAEISFSYTDDPTGTWFQISTSSQPVIKDRLTTWDTTYITDGDYILRLRVFLVDGNIHETLINGLRVRNYTPVETPTPVPVAPEATSIATFTPTVTPYSTPTGLPRNPAMLTPIDVSTSILYGGLAAVLGFILLGIYLWLRRK